MTSSVLFVAFLLAGSPHLLRIAGQHAFTMTVTFSSPPLSCASDPPGPAHR